MSRCCRHCQRPKVNRPLGLCYSCYYAPGVRALYPSTSKYNRRGSGNGIRHNAPLPAFATPATPGSEEKQAELQARAERGEALWHPADAPMDPDERPWHARRGKRSLRTLDRGAIQ